MMTKLSIVGAFGDFVICYEIKEYRRHQTVEVYQS